MNPEQKISTAFFLAVSLLFLIGILSGCSRAIGSERARAERVFTAESGYVCFIIRDDDGKGVGGNCVRE